MLALDENLHYLSLFCRMNTYNEENSNNRFSEWVSTAIHRYIRTGRASIDFERWFARLSKAQIRNLVIFCLVDNELSDEEILKHVKIKFDRRRKK